MPTGSVVAALYDARNWITYSPSESFNPNQGQQPTEAEIRTDLELLYQTGFRGLITYTMDGVQRETARIAKSVGFTQVIAGVYWFDDAQLAREKVAATEELPYIDAFIVGNEGLLENRYSRAELEQEIVWFQTNTLKPVSTTETGGDAIDDPTLLDLGDFVTVNIQPWFNGSLNPNNPAGMATAVANEYAALKALQPNRPIIVKEAWFPSAGPSGATEVNQSTFFAALAATPVVFAWGEAFDQYWKNEPGSPFGTLGNSWGMFESDRTPKAIVATLANVYTTSYNRIDEMLGRAMNVLGRMNNAAVTGGLPVNEATAAELDQLGQGTVPTGQRQWVPGQVGFGMLAQIGSHAYRKLKTDFTGGLSDSELHATLNATLGKLETIFADSLRHYKDPVTQAKALYQRYDTLTATPLIRDRFENAIPLLDNAEVYTGLRATGNYLSGLTDLDGTITPAQFAALVVRINALVGQMDFRMWFDGANLRIGGDTPLGTNPIPASGAIFDRITSETRLAAVAAFANGDLNSSAFANIITSAINSSKIGTSPNGSLIQRSPYFGTALEFVGATPLLASELATQYGQGTLLASVPAHRNVVSTLGGGLPAFGATGVADGNGGFLRLALSPSEKDDNPHRDRQVLVPLAAGMVAGSLGKLPLAGSQEYGNQAVKNLEDALDVAIAAGKYHANYGLPNAIDLGAGIINSTSVWGYLETAEFATALLQYKLGGDFYENLLRRTAGWNVAFNDYLRLLNERQMEAVASNAPGVSAIRANATGGFLTDTILAGQSRDFRTNTWHIETVGNTLTYPLPIAVGGRSSIAVTYSNDDTGVRDTIEVLIDGRVVNSFQTVDTNDWTSFTTTTVDLDRLSPGLRSVSFRLATTDGFGIDFEKFAHFQWNNASTECDVDGDGSVSGIDLIYVAEALNTPGDEYVPNRSPRPTRFIDVNGDNFISAFDLVLVAEAINSTLLPFSLASEFAPTSPISPAEEFDDSIAIGLALALANHRSESAPTSKSATADRAAASLQPEPTQAQRSVGVAELGIGEMPGKSALAHDVAFSSGLGDTIEDLRGFSWRQLEASALLSDS